MDRVIDFDMVDEEDADQLTTVLTDVIEDALWYGMTEETIAAVLITLLDVYTEPQQTH